MKRWEIWIPFFILGFAIFYLCATNGYKKTAWFIVFPLLLATRILLKNRKNSN
jgi:hypothetical protein